MREDIYWTVNRKWGSHSVYVIMLNLRLLVSTNVGSCITVMDTSKILRYIFEVVT